MKTSDLRTLAIIAFSLGWVLVVSVFPQQAHAAVTKWYCDCVPAATAPCSCDGYQFKLKPMGTREFRGFCTGTGGNGKLLAALRVKYKAQKTTCTIDVFRHGYASKSCTNWELLFPRNVTMTLICARPP